MLTSNNLGVNSIGRNRINFSSGKKSKSDYNSENKENKDPLMQYPLRLCAYTNEIGAAILPIPEIGPTLFKLSWIPALMYFGADIYDKYAKGENEDYKNPSRGSALKQAVFQGLASVLLPTIAVIMGQNVFSGLSKHIFKDKMDVRAKEDILKELKRDVNQDRLRSHRDEINEILEKNPNLTLNEIKQNKKIIKIKKTLSDNIYKELKTECDTLRQRRKNQSFLGKFIEIFKHSNKECSHAAKIKENIFESKVKPYLEEQVDELVDTRVKIQRAINKDGTLNEYAKNLDKKTIKKISGLLKKNKENRDILNKCAYVVKECVLSQINKNTMKLSVIKIIGGFTALALLAEPIDHFVKHTVISKVVEPGIEEFGEKVQNFYFNGKKLTQ